MKKIELTHTYEFLKPIAESDSRYFVRCTSSVLNTFFWCIGYETSFGSCATVGPSIDSESELGKQLEKEYQEKIK